MGLIKFNLSVFSFVIVLSLGSCKQEKQWEGQEPIAKVSTESVPIQLQYKGTFDLGKGVFITNEFEGARLNGAVRSNDSLITILISPENSPINMSPWYAFKIWSTVESEVYLKLTYPETAGHRYVPKLSQDGLNWKSLDSAAYQVTMKTGTEGDQIPGDATMKLSVGTDTLWIAAQELITSFHVNYWMHELESHSFVTKTIIGKSTEGRPIHLLKIGESDDQNMVMIISRQHPPEVTGFLAMQAFVETICSDNEIAEKFRTNFNTYVVPLVNPDGVDHGHWRHNKGGVDLNRDWADFNQPETSAIKEFMIQKTTDSGGKFFLSVDFHSTWEDIFYTISPAEKGNMPGLVPEIIAATAKEFINYVPNIKPRSDMDAKITSSTFFFYEFGAEALTYEIGDNTPREFVLRKGEVSAIKMMDLMLQRIY